MSIRLHGFLPHQALPGAINVPSGRADPNERRWSMRTVRGSPWSGRIERSSLPVDSTASRNVYRCGVRARRCRFAFARLRSRRRGRARPAPGRAARRACRRAQPREAEGARGCRAGADAPACIRRAASHTARLPSTVQARGDRRRCPSRRRHQRMVASTPTVCSACGVSLSRRVALRPKDTSGALALAAGVRRQPRL